MGVFGSTVPFIGGAIDSFLNPGEAYKKARREMERKWNEAKEFQRPYSEAGLGQLDTLKGAEGALLDPSKLLADWMNKYEMSPYAKKSLENAKSSGLDAASSMGLMGSSSALNNIQNSSSDIMNADRSQFLNDLMQKYLSGIGIGQNIYNQGAATAGNLGNQALKVGENTGAAAYGQASAGGDLIKNLLGMGAKMFMASQGGGAALGL